RDRPRLRRRNGGRESRKASHPDVRGHAQTVAYPVLDVPVGHVVIARKPGQRLFDPGGIDRVGELIYLVGKGWPAPKGARCADEDQPVNATRHLYSDLLGDVATAGGPEQDSRL